ncbi:ATP-binding protein [Caldalkalibacillus salinus]|uniref:ATP-binding protein n=1 Tax=Caldalkalibacillus salinus TaxID=2803787 RepID=UPI001920ADCF
MNIRSCVQVDSELDIVAARQTGREMAKDIGFSEVEQARIATAISELARNIFLYAHTGTICISYLEEEGQMGIQIESQDRGPGISDVQQAMEDGYTTSGGLGAGLPGVKRLMDSFHIQSQSGSGTQITGIKWLR